MWWTTLFQFFSNLFDKNWACNWNCYSRCCTVELSDDEEELEYIRPHLLLSRKAKSYPTTPQLSHVYIIRNSSEETITPRTIKL